MATTSARLQGSSPSHDLAFSLVFGGVNLVYTSLASSSPIVTAFASTDWTVVKTGLHVIGQTQESIDIFQPRVTPTQLEFRITDADGTLSDYLFAPLKTTTFATFLRSNASPADLSIKTTDNTLFSNSGYAYCGTEAFYYRNKTLDGYYSSSFEGCRRGQWSLWRTNAGDRLGSWHKREDDADPWAGNTPKITSTPTVWYNRPVVLLVHHKETDGDGNVTWSTVAQPWSSGNAKAIWAGRIKDWSDNTDGSISLTCTSIHEVLSKTLFLDQYQADAVASAANDGHWKIATRQSGIGVKGVANSLVGTGGGPEYAYVAFDGQLDITGGFSEGYYGAIQIMSMINDQLTAWQADSTINTEDKWSVELVETEQGKRTQVQVEFSSAHNYISEHYLYLNPHIWRILGFKPPFDPVTPDEAVGDLAPRRINRDSSSRKTATLISDTAPLTFIDPNNVFAGAEIRVSNQKGTWHIQKNMPSEAKRYEGSADNPDTGFVNEGFIQIGEKLVTANLVQTGSESYFRVGQLFSAPGEITQYNVGDKYAAFGTMDTITEPPKVKQIFIERGNAGDILARLLLSTGVPGLNHEDLDVLDDHMAANIPAEMLDIDSVRNMPIPYELRMSAPTKLKQLLEEVLQVYNKYLVQQDGKLVMTRPGFDVTEPRSFVALTEANKANGEPSQYRIARDGIVNNIVLNYSTVLKEDKVGTHKVHYTEVTRVDRTVELNDKTSQSDHGTTRSLEITAKGVLDPESWAESVAKPAIAYWGRPLATITRSINSTMLHLRPGNLATITDDFIKDPSTGTRGIADKPCWVKSVSFDYSTASGQVELVYMPELDVARVKSFAPCALVDASYTSGSFTAGYDSTNKKFRLVAREFALSTEDKDVTHFEVNDVIRITEKSPVAPRQAETFTDTITAIDTSNNEITISGGITHDSTKEYIIESDIWSEAQATQLSHAYLADEVNEKIEDSGDPDLWSGDTPDLDAYVTTVDYDTEYIRTAESDYDDGDPFSARKMVYAVTSMNNLLSWKSRNVLYSMPANASGTVVETATSYSLVLGPIWIPLYGVNRNETTIRNLNGHFSVGRSSGAFTTYDGTVLIRTSSTAAKGTSASSPVYPYANTYIEKTFTSTDWTSISIHYTDSIAFGPITPVPTYLNGHVGTWLTIEMKGDAGNTGGGQTFSISDFTLVESEVDTSEQIPIGLDVITTETGESLYTETSQSLVTES